MSLVSHFHCFMSNLNIYIYISFFHLVLYTIDGNAFGRPCVFPFMYNNVWYSDCTKVDSHLLWCSVETKYENEVWGYCPTNSEYVILYFNKCILSIVYVVVNRGYIFLFYLTGTVYINSHCCKCTRICKSLFFICRPWTGVK